MMYFFLGKAKNAGYFKRILVMPIACALSRSGQATTTDIHGAIGIPMKTLKSGCSIRSGAIRAFWLLA